MSFPQDRLPVVVELNLGGTWTDITGYVYSRDQITISRGRSAEGSTVDPGRAMLTLNNRDGRFTPRNPTGPYYGSIGRNTALRISAAAGSPWLDCPAGATVRASTPDAAAIDITGDLDVRVELEPSQWIDPAGVRELAGRYQSSGNQVSWLLTLTDAGKLQLWWSPDGTTGSLQNAVSTAAVDLPRRGAVRAALDVDNGAGGWTVTFSTATSIASPWAQLGNPVTVSGVTSLFNTSAPLEVGDVQAVGYPNVARKIYRFELRNGIDGAVVANPDFTAQAPGVTSFTDGAGRTWSVTAGGLANRRVRFVGEVSEWPARWSTGGQDVWVPVQASGILRRLGQGAAPLQSAMRRELSNPARAHIVAYWPCEDGPDSTTFASAIPDAAAMTTTRSGVTPAADDTWPASDALPTMGTGVLRGPVPTYSATGQTALRMAVKPPQGGVAAATRLVTLHGTGTAPTWQLWINTTAQMALRAYDKDGTVLLDTGYVAVYGNGELISFGVELTESAGNVSYNLVAYRIADILYGQTIPQVSWTGTVAGCTVGRVTSIVIGEDGGLGATTVGHVALADSTAAYTATGDALIGWAGETARGRVERVCDEEKISRASYGGGVERVGPQHITTLLGILGQAADVGGTLLEQREDIGLLFRAREVDCNQPVTLALAYADVAPPLEPTDDDQQVRNDITVQRDKGGTARATLDTGPLSVQPPPDGVGRYDSSVSLNLYDDEQPAQHASWRLHLGTWDATRYPVIALDLAARPSLIDAATALDIGDRLTISNPPPWLPPEEIDELVLGYTETLSQYTWALRFNCAPAGPWQVGVVGDDVYGRADTDGSQLATAVTSPTATTLSVTTTSGPTWTTDPTDCPFDVTIGGEVMTVTAISGATSPQTFTVTRGVNGITTTPAAGTDVRLARPTIVAL